MKAALSLIVFLVPALSLAGAEKSSPVGKKINSFQLRDYRGSDRALVDFAKSKLVADQFGAVRTPEVFVLDSKRIIRYWGRIDDQYGVGYTRPKPGRRDLATALEELLDGKTVSTPVTEASGCFIGRVRKEVKDS